MKMIPASCIETLCIVIKVCYQSRVPRRINEQKQIVHMYNEASLSHKKNKILIFTAKWMEIQISKIPKCVCIYVLQITQGTGKHGNKGYKGDWKIGTKILNYCIVPYKNTHEFHVDPAVKLKSTACSSQGALERNEMMANTFSVQDQTRHTASSHLATDVQFHAISTFDKGEQQSFILVLPNFTDVSRLLKVLHFKINFSMSPVIWNESQVLLCKRLEECSVFKCASSSL